MRPVDDAKVGALLRRLAALEPPFLGGAPPRRKPMHVVYGGAHLFAEGTVEKLGALARQSFARYAPDARAFGEALGLAPTTHDRVFALCRDKLAREPIEDFRIDFEDGYGVRDDAEEDRHADAAGVALARAAQGGRASPLSGIRIKALSGPARERGARTLVRFLTALVGEGGALPSGFVVCLPKVRHPEEAAVLDALLSEVEEALGLAPASLLMELMLETPQLLLGTRGVPLVEAVKVARRRVVGVHIGSYDLTASLGVVAHEQALAHPHCDFAKHVMQIALAGAGLALSDGATTTLPVEPHKPAKDGALDEAHAEANRRAVVAAWRLHADAVRHGLRFGILQGWDLHPAQVPARFGAVFGFFAEALPSMLARRAQFRAALAQATRVGQAFDDAATAEGIENFFRFGEAVGALSPAEASAAAPTTPTTPTT